MSDSMINEARVLCLKCIYTFVKCNLGSIKAETLIEATTEDTGLITQHPSLPHGTS